MAKRRKPPKGFSLQRKCSLLLKNFPRHLKDGFKAYCARRGITMRQRIMELIQADANSDINAMKKSKSYRTDGGGGHDDNID